MLRDPADPRSDQDMAGAYLAALRRAIADLPDSNKKTRRAVYEQAEEAQRLMFAAFDPPATEEDLDYEYRLFRQTVRLLEEDLRNAVDVQSPSYRPAGLDALHARLVRARDARRARRLADLVDKDGGGGALSAEQALVLDRLHAALCFIDMPGVPPRSGPRMPGVIATLRALLIHQFQALEGESRLAIPWMLVQPAVLLALISSLYFLTGSRFVLNMDVPTFALLGAGTWIMCRQIIFRVSTGMAHHRVAINLPAVTPLLSALAQTLLCQIIFVVSLTLLLALGHVAGITTRPHDLTGVALYFCGLSGFALGVGIVFGVIANAWPFFLRFATVIERAMQLVSSVYFVTEQLPTAYKPLILWNPAAHGMQLLRAHYFAGYAAPDASPPYFWLTVTAFLCATLGLERLVRPDIQPL